MNAKKIKLESADSNSADLLTKLSNLNVDNLQWRKTIREGLNLDYVKLFTNATASQLLKEFEDTIVYYDGELSKVKVFGKWHKIPRQQVAYGDDNVKYRFSGTVLPTKAWTGALRAIKDLIKKITGHDYNFVLINRYRDGNDHIGEHRDAEPEIDPHVPIVSLSLGQQRRFVLRHGDCRKKGTEKRNMEPVKMDLEHGSLLLMNPPTNKFWYHSLPARKSAPGVRVNLTFRKIFHNKAEECKTLKRHESSVKA